LITSFLKSVFKTLPPFRRHLDRVDALVGERDRLAWEFETYKKNEWARLKERKAQHSAQIRANGPTSRLVPPIAPIPNHLNLTVSDWIAHQVKAEPYWFQKIEVLPGLFSAGWSDPVVQKLPWFGLPEDLTGMRVLDIGCAEGFFSFEAERRGAREVIGIDSYPESIRRFNIVKAARQSNCSAFLMNVYDLEPRRLGTFDLVLFYGVFYHLRHPQLALERIRSICSGTLLFQTHITTEPSLQGVPWARYYPHGKMSGTDQESFDPTVFWLFNGACCVAMVDHVGFTNIQVISDDPAPFVARAEVPNPTPGVPPDQAEAPWC